MNKLEVDCKHAISLLHVGNTKDVNKQSPPNLLNTAKCLLFHIPHFLNLLPPTAFKIIPTALQNVQLQVKLLPRMQKAPFTSTIVEPFH